MLRRQFIAASAATAASSALSPRVSNAATPIDAVAEIKRLRIGSGPLAGAYLIAPAGRVNWYFSNLGLLPLVWQLSGSELDLHVRTYLDLYLSRLEPDMSIRDVELPSGPSGPLSLALSDSDDSYAATFLSLASRYLAASGDGAWWNARKARLFDVAYRNLAVSAKPSGLTRVFQAPRSSTNSTGYLMDNCESYRGLRDFAAALRLRGDSADAAYYDSFAGAIGAAISRDLWVPAFSAFRASDSDAGPTVRFYPGATCQAFPQAFGVAEAASRFDQAWAYLNSASPNWQDGRYDPFPWAILGFVAAKRGQWDQARAQLSAIDSLFASNRGLVTINELGYHLLSSRLVSGLVDV